MRIAIVTTTEFATVDPMQLTVEQAEQLASADIAICVYQNMVGEAQVDLLSAPVGTEVVIFDGD